jgi:hypothetical protein
LRYKSPPNATAGTRHDIKAGTRGWTDKLPSIYVLAPDHVGLTTRAQPTLFWYQSAPTNTRMELTIIVPHQPGWLLRVGIDKSDQPGIHRLSLERYHVTLVPGVIYKWTVALVPNPNSRSQDIIASDLIQRVEPDNELKGALARSQGLEKAGTYATNSIWYDALDSITNEIDAAPHERDLHFLRASLLEQGGLTATAAFERK